LNAAATLFQRMTAAGIEFLADGSTYDGERALTELFRWNRGNDIAQMGGGVMLLHNLAAS